MKEHKTIKDGFKWVPPHERLSRFGGPVPPGAPELRFPVLWLARQGNELYLVNSSGGALDSVIADAGGFLTADDGAVPVTGNNRYNYRDVRPDDAVKVEEYDGLYDLDYILHIALRIRSESLGCIDIVSPAKKGGVGETVLLWSTGENGKGVSITRCQPA